MADLTDQVKILYAPKPRDYMIYDELPRATKDKLPLKCSGCGCCCGPGPLFSVEMSQKEKYLKETWPYHELRGMVLRQVGGFLWVCTPACKHLSKHNLCKIQSRKPEICRLFKKGCDDCLLALELEGGEYYRI